MTFLTLTHDPTVLQHSSWVLDLASTPIGEFVLYLCPCSLLRFYLFNITAHPAFHVNVWTRAMLCMCSGTRIIGYVILKLK